MKKVIRFSRFFIPAFVISLIIVILGIAGFVTKDGFNLGVDFQAGLLQEIQLAPTAFELTYNGPGNASITLARNSLDIVISGAAVEEVTHRFLFSDYKLQGELVRVMMEEVKGLHISQPADIYASPFSLLQSAQSSPLLEASKPLRIHYLEAGDDKFPPVKIDEVRSGLLSFGTVSVQALGDPSERRFMIRVEDKEIEAGESTAQIGRSQAEKIVDTLENTFGKGAVAVTRSDYVGSRFSKNLTDQAGLLICLTLLLMLVYMTFRFKLQYAVGAVIGIVYDGIVIIAFVVWTRMEFNTTTIAALLTILGYSTNNTIVVFDRIREIRRIFPDDAFVDVLNRSLTGTLNRTFITTLTTMVAVLALVLFTTGSMKDFAVALVVGLISGVYTTTFIASGFIYFWELKKNKREKQKMAMAQARA